MSWWGWQVALLKGEVPHLVDVYCLAHRLELGALDAINDAMKKVTEMVTGIVLTPR